MFKYRFECSSEERIREDFEYMMQRDQPYISRWHFGRRMYSSGIHFVKIDKRISGFYLEHADDDTISRRGREISVSFVGKFVRKNGKTYFDVYIYPSIVGTVILAVVVGCFVLSGEPMGIAIALIATLIFGYGYVRSINGAAEFFKNWIR